MTTAPNTDPTPATFDPMPHPEMLARQAEHISAAIDKAGAETVVYSVAPFPRAAQDAAGTASAALSAAVDAIRHALDEGKAIADNSREWPQSRRERLAELLAETDKVIAEATADAPEAARMADEAAYRVAVPEVPTEHALIVRADIDMLTRNATPSELPKLLESLVTTDSPIAHLVASPWGELFMRSRGVEPRVINAAMTAIRAKMIDTVATSSESERRRKAAEAATSSATARRAAAAAAASWKSARAHLELYARRIPKQ